MAPPTPVHSVSRRQSAEVLEPERLRNAPSGWGEFQATIGRSIWKCSFCLLAFVPLVLFPSAARAGTVNWGTLRFQTYFKSDSTPLDDTFLFELGGFADEFTPTSGNTHLWWEKWRPAQRQYYTELPTGLSASYEVASNASPFQTNQQGYIWGHHGGVAAGEWILLTSPSWKWPEVSVPGNPDPGSVSWTSATATQIILGQINGSGFHLKTAAVTNSPLRPVTPTEWLPLRFSTLDLLFPTVSGWNADADGDGVSNLIEYVTGRNPKAATQVWKPAPSFLTVGSFKHLHLDIPRCGYAQATLIVQVSGDLNAWGAHPSDVTTLASSPDKLWVRDNTAADSASKRFIRLKASIP